MVPIYTHQSDCHSDIVPNINTRSLRLQFSFAATSCLATILNILNAEDDRMFQPALNDIFNYVTKKMGCEHQPTTSLQELEPLLRANLYQLECDCQALTVPMRERFCFDFGLTVSRLRTFSTPARPWIR